MNGTPQARPISCRSCRNGSFACSATARSIGILRRCGDAGRLVEVLWRDELELRDQQVAQLAIGQRKAGRFHAARSAKNVRTRSTSISSAMFDLMM